MSETSGNHVTRAELDAHLTPMRADIREIKGDVKSLLRGQAGSSALRNAGKWLLPLVVSAGTSGVVAMLIH